MRVITEQRRQYQREYQLERALRLRAEWIEANGPCAKCGGSEELEVDHIDPEQKVSHRVWSWSRARREAELAKCQVLCRGCHQTKTVEQLTKPVPHGTHSGYSYHGCRCDVCKAAHAEYNRTNR